MSSFLGDSERRCSGYDEYEGIFGPLAAGAAPSSGRPPFISRRRVRRHARPPSPTFDRRAKYLASQSDKRRQRQLGQLNERSSVSGAPPVSSLVRGRAAGERQQVWLPSRSFAFRQRSGKLDTRAIARLDLEKIAATTDVEAIQRHLENLAFADVTLDDVQQYSDAYFLKLFQIAQLTLEYLMHVQDSLVDHSESLESQCEQLLGECQQLEADNDKQEAEIAGLKRDIRQKQRTMATLELMLLNASSRKLPSARTSDDKENASKEANTLVDELLTSTERDEELGVQPIECVLCEKRFVSVEYLLHHQEKKHQHKHRKLGRKSRKKKSRSISPASSRSSSSSSSDKQATRRDTPKQPVPAQDPAPPPPLPKEVLDALEQKNQLALQLLELQNQVRAEQDARDSQRRQMESQQSQLTTQVMEHFGQLQSALVAIEKRQEAAKQDMIKHTEDAIKRMQEEAIEAARRARKEAASRIGTLESDHEDATVHPVGAAQVKSSGVEWSQMEKLMDTFLRAQALKQQEIDALQEQNAKLASKAVKRKKPRREYPEMPTTLLAMAALDAARFGVDYGQRSADLVPSPAVTKAAVDEKTIQTDEEEMKLKTAPRVESRPIQTDKPAAREDVARRSAIQVRSSRKSVPAVMALEMSKSTRVSEQPVSAKPVSTETTHRDEPKQAPVARGTAQGQAAARVIAKAVLRYLRLKQLVKLSTWHLKIPVARLEKSLQRTTLAQLRRTHGDHLSILVTRGMTPNRLRCMIADTLSGGGRDSVQTFSLQDADDEDDNALGGGEPVTLERVVLRDRSTRAEMRGDVAQIHLFKEELEVEVLPPVGNAPAAENQLPIKDATRGVTRLQARVRGFLARRAIHAKRVNCRQDDAAARMKAPVPVAQIDDGTNTTGAGEQDGTLARHSEQRDAVRRRLRAALIGRVSGSSAVASIRHSSVECDDCDDFSAEAVSLCLANVGSERKKLSDQAQQRILQLEVSVDVVVKEEVPLEFATDEAIDERQRLETTRRRLDKLLSGIRTPIPALVGGVSPSGGQTLLNELIAAVFPIVQAGPAEVREEASVSTPLSSLRESESSEIEALADAYEQCGDDVSAAEPKTAVSDTPTLSTARRSSSIPAIQQPITRLRHAERSVSVSRAVPVGAAVGTAFTKPGERPGTPTPEPDSSVDAGRSSLETGAPTSKTISPFSKTPLISRRARRGTGFENAR